MKIGVIGAGQWGKNLVRTFNELRVLNSVAETNSDLCKELASEYPHLTIYPDALSLIRSDMDAVVIATPVSTHYQLAKEALLAGKDVFVEKPMTMDSKEAEEIAFLAKERDRILMVGHILLFQPAIQWIQEAISSGVIGDLKFLSQERLKFGRVRNKENVLWSFGVHDIAVLLYLIGDVPVRIGVAGQRVVQAGIEDDVYVHMDFPKRIKAHLHVSWIWPESRRTLTVVGSKGMIVYRESEQEVILHRKTVAKDLEIQDFGESTVFSDKAQPLLIECKHFINCLKTRTDPVTHGLSALRVIRVLEQAQDLMKSQLK